MKKAFVMFSVVFIFCALSSCSSSGSYNDSSVLSSDEESYVAIDSTESSNDFSTSLEDSSEDSVFTSVVFELVHKQGGAITDKGVKHTIEILKDRIREPGAKVYSISDTKIQIDIPGEKAPEEIIRRYGKNGELNFRNSAGDILMTSSAIKTAYPSINPETNAPVVSLELTNEGKKLFKQVTTQIAASTDKTLSIYVGDDLISSPTVPSAIDGEMGVIIQSESFVSDPTECEDLASFINAGVMEYELVATTHNN